MGNREWRMKMDWYLMVWRRFGDFGGRSRRKEYWMFSLFNCIFSAPVYLAGLLLKGTAIGVTLLALYMAYCLAITIPSMSVMVRRLHDTGRSGWWWLIALIPIVGGIILLVFLVQDSEPKSNLWGPSPKKELKIVDEKAALVAAAVAATATVDDYEQWLKYLAQPNRPPRKPGMSVQDEYNQWLLARARARVAPPKQ
jgi:uncharacterized membrane protein YhaH (DUF805 family)